MTSMYRKILFCLVLLMAMSAMLQAQPASSRRTTLMGLGDSITEGSDHFSTYLCPLWRLLADAGYRFDFIGPRTTACGTQKLHHCGFSGKNVEYLDSMIDSIYRLYPADIVLLHAGHNHFIEEQPVEGMIAAYESIIRKVTAIRPDVHILIAKVIPSGKLPKYSYIPRLNKEIGRMVKRLQSDQVTLVDQSRGFDWRRYTIDDKVHPNEQGAEHIASVWFKALAKVMKQSF